MRLIGIAVLVALVGCGGKGKNETNEPSGGGSGATWDPAERDRGGRDGELVTQECLDNVNQVFSRKQRQVESCYSKAVESGKLSRKVGGRINIEARITPAGRATDVTVSDASTLKSQELNDCIITMIESWDIPKPNVAFQFTFAYQFLAWE